MSPKLRFLIDAFHDSIYFIAQEASNLRALQGPIIEQHLAPLAIPIASRQIIFNVSTIATLMCGDITEVTENNLVVIFILIVEADVALNVLINIVLVDIDLLNGVILIDRFCLSQVDSDRALFFNCTDLGQGLAHTVLTQGMQVVILPLYSGAPRRVLP
jgi:hypothetical protein